MPTHRQDYSMLIDLIQQETGLENEILNQDFSIDYIKKLTLLSLGELLHQQEKLDSQAKELEAKKFEILSSNYKSFLAANQFLVDLQEKLAVIVPGIDIVNEWPLKVVEKFKECEKSRVETIQTRSEVQLLASRLDQLEPILEIPALFSTLLRNGHHEEAMDLQLFTQRLPVRYPNIPYLTRLASIETNSQAMLAQLLSILRGPLKLPVAMRVIGYLKRLNYKDSDLRVLFLTLRFEYLCSLLAIVKETQPQEYIRRWIETQRENLFDIVTHYKHIFPPTPQSSSRKSSTEDQILSSFSLMAVSNLIKVLESFLGQANDVSILPSVCTQIMYYGMTLGRIGLDFRSIVVPMFEKTVSRIVSSLFHHASSVFTISQSVERPLVNTTGQALLMKSMAVATLFNQYMNALNQLRYLPCLSLYSTLLKSLTNSMESVVSKLEHADVSAKRDAEIMAWIISDGLLEPLFDGFHRVMNRDADSTCFALFSQRLGVLAKAAKGISELGGSNLSIENEIEQTILSSDNQVVEDIVKDEDNMDANGDLMK